MPQRDVQIKHAFPKADLSKCEKEKKHGVKGGPLHAYPFN